MITYGHGLTGHWLNANQCWLLQWGDSHIVGLFHTRDQIDSRARELTEVTNERERAERLERLPWFSE